MEKLREEMIRTGGEGSLSWSKVDVSESGVPSPVPGETERVKSEELARRAEEAMRLVQERDGETSVVDGRGLVPGEAEGKHSIEFLEVCLRVSSRRASHLILVVAHFHISSSSCTNYTCHQRIILTHSCPCPQRALPRVGPVHATVAIQTADLEPTPAAAQEPSTAHTQDPSHDSSSPNWEDVPSSMNSSFPSMSFPDASRSHSETPSHPNTHSHPSHHHHTDHAHSHHTHHDEKDSPKVEANAPTSATLAIFDSTLSTKTRAWALVSALAINMALPFVNGVMLGFGELFAKEIIAPWLGWKPAGMRVGLSGAAAGGAGADVRRERERERERNAKRKEL